MQQDPTVSQVKLIAEPWDVGPGGYQVGNFPPQWTEWNGKYRDTVRDYWRGEPATLDEFAYRLTGSADLYEHTAPPPRRVHQLRHRPRRVHAAGSGVLQRETQRGQQERTTATARATTDRGTAGRKGPTDDPEINALRAQQQRNFLATLLLSQGVPMISHGDELGRTQQGNNNVYCQDNELSWIDWAQADTDLMEFTRAVSALRAAHPVFRRRRFFSGRPVRQRGAGGLPDIAWFAPDGSEMTEEDWETGFAKSVAVYLNGQGIPDLDVRGQRVTDDSFVLCFNAHHEPIEFALPPEEFGTAWVPVIYTAEREPPRASRTTPGAKVTIDARAVMVLRATSPRLVHRRRRRTSRRPPACRRSGRVRARAARGPGGRNRRRTSIRPR